MSGDDETAFGWWPSRWTAAEVAAGRVSRSGLAVADHTVYWCESRPSEGGRQVVVGSRTGRAAEDLSPPEVSVRSRVHEYGGAAATIAGSTLYYVDQADQRWYRSALEPAGTPEPLTPDGGTTSRRFADGRPTASGRWLISVEEIHDGATSHALVAVATDGSGRVEVLDESSDFVAAPRPSPEGSRLAWIAWDHPSMPWDRSELRVAVIEESAEGIVLRSPVTVAGGAGRSVGQPHWCRDGALVFVDDRSGWWLPNRLPADGSDPVELVHLEAEFHGPDWILGQSTIAELEDGTLLCRCRRSGSDSLVRLAPGPAGADAPGWTLTTIDQPCVSLAGVAAADDGSNAYVLGATPSEAHCVLELPLGGREAPRRISAGPGRRHDPRTISVAGPYVAAAGRRLVPGQVFAPASPDIEPEVPPPLVVFCHGGPTGSFEPGFDPVVQFFTSRGLAVAGVDYRGSSGYGREYRERLAGQWGVADVEDCAAFAHALATEGLVDGTRMAIRGTSAGGLTALGALIRTDLFAGAASWYGVTDLESLAADTHDFESRYLESLVGPWPGASARYRERSPIHHADRVNGRVLLLQGAEDPVVPPDQSVRFAEMLGEHGVDCRLVVFEGESHGFRSAATIEACLNEELAFYQTLFRR
ncbi:MAG: prolyl oligopeptidase family serine peptidase [Acidimicrobiales bacterium]